MHITTFVLPYHLHSFQATQIVPYLEDKCASDSSKCLMEKYIELTWANLDWVLKDDALSEKDFEK